MRVLVADDSSLVRRAVCGLLSAQEGYEVCAEASEGAETIRKAMQFHPDVVLLDISMPGKNGIEVAHVLRQSLPNTKIIIVSHNDVEQLRSGAMNAGAAGGLDKAKLACDLIPTLRSLGDS